MKILCNLNIAPSKLVNIVGKSLYNHIDSAFEFRSSANMYDVYFTVYYQIVEDLRDDDDTEIHEMVVNINITTYDNYLRINIYTSADLNQLIAFDKYNITRYNTIQHLVQDIYIKTLKRLTKFYYDCDFIF